MRYFLNFLCALAATSVLGCQAPEDLKSDSDQPAVIARDACEYEWADADHDSFLSCTAVSDACPCEALGGYTTGPLWLNGVLQTNHFIDCNDADPDITAHVSDVAYNGDWDDGKDNDCDGKVDENVKRVFRDRDGDGFAEQLDQQIIWSDESIFGYIDARADLAWDCDDEDPRVNPGKVETPFNQWDENCDGTELCLRDADGDHRGTDEIVKGPVSCQEFGFTLPWWPPTDRGADTPDCNDHDPLIKPGISEIPDNGVDENCDGDDFFYCGVELKFLIPQGEYVPFHNELYLDAKRDNASMDIYMLTVPDPANPLAHGPPRQTPIAAGGLWQETPVFAQADFYLHAGGIIAYAPNVPYAPVLSFSVRGYPDEVLLSAAEWDNARDDVGSGFSPLYYMWGVPRVYCDYDQPYDLACTDETQIVAGVAVVAVSCK